MSKVTAARSDSQTVRRARPSERALRIALKAARDEGMIVEKLCVMGGHIEIYFAGIDPNEVNENHGSLDEW